MPVGDIQTCTCSYYFVYQLEHCMYTLKIYCYVLCHLTEWHCHLTTQLLLNELITHCMECDINFFDLGACKSEIQIGA